MPTFNGTNIFGTAVQMQTPVNPVELQKNPFPGLSGVQSLPMGQRGAVTTCTGLLFGSNVGNLAAALTTFRSFYDGLPYVLVDSLGIAWSNVILKAFVPTGRIRQSPFGFYFQTYNAEFDHLTNS